jgi:hypothetical protein
MANTLPGMDEKYPVVWLHMLWHMRDLVLNKKRGVITKQEFIQLAKEHCNITSLQEVDDMLDFFHDTGEVLYFSDKAVLRTVVVLNPGSLLEVAAEITSTEKISEHLANTQGGTAEHAAWKLLLEQGQLQRVLLTSRSSLLWQANGSQLSKAKWLQALAELDVCFLPAGWDEGIMNDDDVVAWVPCRLPSTSARLSGASHQWAYRCHKWQVEESHLKGTHYETLGVRWKSSLPTIERAYRRKALQCHPDKVPKSEWDAKCEEKWHELEAAKKALSNTTTRNQYDSGIQHKASVDSGAASREYILPQSLFQSLVIGLCNLIPQKDIAHLSLAKGYMRAALPRTKYLFSVDFVESKQLVAMSIFLEPGS